MTTSVSIERGVAVTGAVAMWSRVVHLTIEKARQLLPPGSRVAEVGYGDGLLSCYLADHCGWRVTGFESSSEAYEKANRNAREAGVADRVDLRLVEPEETWRVEGKYDGVFIKTVLYQAENLSQYADWLDWVDSVLSEGGVFVNLENGKANRFTYIYRRLRGRRYADLCMYDGDIQRLYDERFDTLYRAHFGAVSQFFAPLSSLYHAIARVEERLFERTADNSYITTIVGRKKTRLGRTA